MDKCVLKIGKYYLASDLDCEDARITTEIAEATIFNLTKNIDDWEEEITSMVDNGFVIRKLKEEDVTARILEDIKHGKVVEFD